MEPTEALQVATDFFVGYGQDLLARDADALAGRYSVPGLILFPGEPVAVTSREQTREFFSGAFDQYEGIRDTRSEITLLANTKTAIWADVTWHHDSGVTERLVYQLVRAGQAWQIAVLTPVEL